LSASQPPQPPAAPPPAPPPAAPPPRPEPATSDDIRSLRRWILVAGVWAVAATAIAVIALIQANKDDSAKIGKETATQVGQVQRDLNKRLDEVESRLNDFAPSSDVAKLDTRLKKVENDLSKATTKLDKVSAQVDDLKTKVDALESQQGTGTNTTQTTTTTQSP
jgi:septal ring factor EnvC (AmiA/AmiB activator)